MSKPPKRRPQARKGRTVAAASSAGKRSDRTSWIIAAVVIVIGAALVFVFAGSSKNKAQPDGWFKGDKAAPASLVSKVTSVSDGVITKVGQGSVNALPLKLPGTTPLKTADGKPRIVYMGAEYCPFCAAERWGILNALSRFGTFKNVKITDSAEVTPNGQAETDPNTPTFSFHGATYTSKYVQFETVEQEDNSYKNLETPSKEQSTLASTYDAPPYVASSEAGSIPFIDFANEYMISGASYDPLTLANDLRDHRQPAGQRVQQLGHQVDSVVAADQGRHAELAPLTAA
jgi:thiol-disulfide isomerase/thioredoxin